jgi:hypothetical protein
METMTREALDAALGEHVAPAGLYELIKATPFLGRVSASLDRMEAGSWQEIVIDYEVGAAGMADGSWFKATMRFYTDWALFQTDDPQSADYVSAEYQAGPLLPGQSPATVQALKVRFDQKGHERPFQKAVIVDVVDGYLKAGDHIIIRLGDRRRGGPGTRVQTFAEENFRIRCYVDPLGTSRFAAVTPDLVIAVEPGQPATLQWAAPRIVRRGERAPMRVRVEDAWGNCCLARTEDFEITTTLGGEIISTQMIRHEGKGWCVLPLDDVPTGTAGELAVTARLPGHPRVPPSTFFATIADELEAPRVFYADLHVHSDDTIGTNSTDYNLRFGRDVAGLDVLAFSHNDFNITTPRWHKTVEEIAAINENGRFVAYPGVEWCGSSCVGGDHNVIFLGEGAPQFPFLSSGEHVRSVEWNEDMKGTSVQPGAWPIEELWAAYARDPQNHLLIPHVGGRRCILDWHHPELERLVEIGSSWGHFPWLYEDAMQRGYKVGASMAGDEHRGRAGGGAPGAAVFGVKGGITGVIAPELTRAAVAQALRARHTFASTGERGFGITRCAAHIMGDAFTHSGPATIAYRFLGDAGFDEIAACDQDGVFWQRNLQEELGFSGRRIRLRWGGARIKDRYRAAVWHGRITVTGGIVNGFTGRGFEHPEEACWREGQTAIGFRSETYGDADTIELDISGLESAHIRVEGTIGGYVKVGNPRDGAPFVHCPAFAWEVSGAELLAAARLEKPLPGAEMFLALERMSDSVAPRDVSGTVEVAPENGSHGFRPVYFHARQIDDAKLWTSAMFITFA